MATRPPSALMRAYLQAKGSYPMQALPPKRLTVPQPNDPPRRVPVRLPTTTPNMQPTRGMGITDLITDPLRALTYLFSPQAALEQVASNATNTEYNKLTPEEQQAPTAQLTAAFRGGKQIVAQPVAGLAEITLANSARPTPKRNLASVVAGRNADKGETGANIAGYRPAIADVLPAFAGAVTNLVSPITGYKIDPNTTGGGWITNSMERSDLASERTNNTLGIESPQDGLQAGLRALGQIAVPGPDATLVTKVLKPLGVFGKAVKPLVELASPLRQGSFGSAAKIVVPTSVGLNALPQVVEPFLRDKGSGSDNLDMPAPSDFGDTKADGLVVPGNIDLANRQIVHNDDGSISTELSFSIGTDKGELLLPQVVGGKILSQDEAIAHYEATGENLGLFKSPEAADAYAQKLHEKQGTRYTPLAEANVEAQGEEDHTLRNLAIGAAVLGTVLAGRKVINLNAQRINAQPFITSDAIGFNVRKSRGGPVSRTAERFATNNFDSLRPVRSAANDSLSVAEAKDVGYRADSITNTAISSRVGGWLRTGKGIPFGKRTYSSPAPLVNQAAKDLTPQEYDAVGKALVYASSIDDHVISGGKNPSFTSVSPADKQAFVDSVKNNPKLAPFFNGAQQSFRENLLYAVDNGTMTPAEASKLLKARPNYAPIVKNEIPDVGKDARSVRYDAQETARGIRERNISEDHAGVQGNARNPLDMLIPNWGTSIKNGVINDFRSTTLDRLAASNAVANDGSPLVRKLPLGQAPKSGTWDRIHTVFENGEMQNYQVNDPSLDLALRMNSRFVLKPLDQWRQFRQTMTTGPIGSLTTAFNLAKSPFYDLASSFMLRAPNMRMGIGSEMISKVSPISLPKYLDFVRSFDPTIALSTLTGAPRYAFDEFKYRMANSLTEALLKPNNALQQLVSGNISDLTRFAAGDNATASLRDWFAQSYENSLKAYGDRIGAFSHNMTGSPDSLTPIQGLNDIAPQYSIKQGQQRFKDAMANGKYLEGLLAGTNVAYLKARTSNFGQLMQVAYESTRNGSAYSSIAANKGHLPDLELASAVRRAGIDTSRSGQGKAIGSAISSFEYLNVGLQQMYGLAHRIKENPATALTNMTMGLSAMLALHYISMSDPDARKRNKLKTPEQRTASISLPGGMEFPVDQSMRMIYGPASTFFDYYSGGMNDSYDDSKWNKPLIDAFDNYLEPDEMDTGAEQSDLWRSIKAAAIANVVTPESSAPISLIESQAGLDPQRTALTGNPSAPMTQTISGFDADKSTVGGLLSADTENIIASVVGSFGIHAVQIADDAWRAANKNPKNGPRAAVDAALARWKDYQFKGSTVNRPLFGDYPGTYSVADANFQQVQNRNSGIKAATDTYNRDIRLDKVDLDDPAVAEYIDSTVTPKTEYIGTEVAAIGGATVALNKQLRTIDKQLAALGKDRQEIDSSPGVPLPERNKGINIITDRRKELYYQRLMAIKLQEYRISGIIGREFTYEGFDPKDYVRPLTPAPAQ